MQLSDRTIVITGAAGGLGAAMAENLAAAGCRLALLDRDADGLDVVGENALSAGAAGVECCTADVSDEAAVEHAFDQVMAACGGVHGLVNNAGITRDALTVKTKGGEVVGEMSLAEWQQVIDVNLTGSFLCGRAAARRMIAAGNEGCIINIASISRAGNIGQANYSASKAGVAALAVTWAKEFARYRIRVASIAPGFIGTEMVMKMKPEAREKLTAAIPAGRVGTPEEVAATVRFILENDYITGRCFDIDGGLRL